MEETLIQKMNNCFIQLNEDEKKSIIQMLEVFLKSKTENTAHITIEQYNKELEEAEAEFEKGDYITHEEMLNLMKRWQRI